MVLRFPLLGLAVLQQLLLATVVALSTTPSARAVSFGELYTTNNFLPALSPAQILVEEIWTQMAGNSTTSSSQTPKGNKKSSTNGDKVSASTEDGSDKVEEAQYLESTPPEPTSGSLYRQEMYDLSSALNKRDGACGAQHTACSAQGYPAFCCTTVAACSRDYYGNIACCPYGAVCTGSVATVAQQTNTPITTTTYQQAATTTTAGSPTTAGAGFIQVSGLTVATVGSTTSTAVSSASMPWQLLVLSLGAVIVQMTMV